MRTQSWPLLISFPLPRSLSSSLTHRHIHTYIHIPIHTPTHINAHYSPQSTTRERPYSTVALEGIPSNVEDYGTTKEHGISLTDAAHLPAEGSSGDSLPCRPFAHSLSGTHSPTCLSYCLTWLYVPIIRCTHKVYDQRMRHSTA